ncbi:leukocyte cell-derived chemotaxin-2-like [Carcharodon carcharias]|uniref:leukocyte cell-derived chemotaxin-2-like n=1 Tax=Carcharodon carcharias TaxID=13397 RepID=UPI001B7E4AA7|nr:leukocyte cell-derived chemotaxin-2-like [Carcharodon carcharias]XP_041034996.1 leukocyte cell-derived chemotaxin-2-like [Carcharodon carcharias]
MLRGLILFILFTQVMAGRWGQLCDGNPTNRVRGKDRYGRGEYGAPRGRRTHLGVDVICSDGSIVHAPFTGRMVRQLNPFGNNNAIDNGAMLEGSGYCVKMFPITAQRYTGSVTKGEVIGRLLNIQDVYPGMISHVHIQMCDTSINPTPYL